MSKSKITTNRIEEVLLEKKQREYSKEVREAVERLCNAINCGQEMDNDEERNTFIKWVKDLIYFNWSNVTPSSKICAEEFADNLPECITKALLKNAVDEFIQSVESTKEIIDGLEF